MPKVLHFQVGCRPPTVDLKQQLNQCREPKNGILMLFLGVKPKVSHKWFRKTICSVDIILIQSHTIYYTAKRSKNQVYGNCKKQMSIKKQSADAKKQAYRRIVHFSLCNP